MQRPQLWPQAIPRRWREGNIIYETRLSFWRCRYGGRGNPIVNSMIQIVLVNVNYEWPKEKEKEKEGTSHCPFLFSPSSTEVTFDKTNPKTLSSRFLQTIKHGDNYPASSPFLLNQRFKVRFFEVFLSASKRDSLAKEGGNHPGFVNPEARKTRSVGNTPTVEEENRRWRRRDALTNCRPTGMVIR